MKRHSEKRDAILNCLRQTKVHPTAEWIYQKLKPEYPNLSLGTVYRNLSEFKREGIIATVGVVDGLERFDGDTRIHSHLICRECGAVIDVNTAEVSEQLLLSAAAETGGEVSGVQLTFSGVCRDCRVKCANF
ncbi:MAG: transcriptional repressor [Clostridiales bacterium]|nr:transcriptional repressor [Clostridiales bacterium]